MGLLVEGKWTSEDAASRIEAGRYVRRESQFRNWITPDGSAGPSGRGGFVAEPGRYHLYISHACPWAHRTMIVRALKGLEGMISISVVHWLMRENGWTFAQGEGVVPDPVGGAKFLYEVYQRTQADYTGRVTVPVLWDLQTGAIVNNESSEIIRMFDSAFDGCGAKAGNYYPAELRNEIDTLNDRIYRTVNNGVYRAGFATTQEAYEEAVAEVFATLDFLEERLGKTRYLCGGKLTEADVRLLPTLVRFDAVYHGHFKCNRRRIVDYPNLWGFVRDLVQRPEIAATINLDHIRRHYYASHLHINPTGVVAVGPDLDFDTPHGREQLGA